MIRHITRITCDACYREEQADRQLKTSNQLKAYFDGWYIILDYQFCPTCFNDCGLKDLIETADQNRKVTL